jgi:hypothetical protein
MPKVKPECCYSYPPRCRNCPVVARRLREIAERGLRGEELRRALKAVRDE